MKTPLVSVIIPCYKQAHYLAQAVESALTQTYSEIEIIVVNDRSPDNVEEVMAIYITNPRVRLLTQENKGLSVARNSGITIAQGQYFQFLDADDWLHP